MHERIRDSLLARWARLVTHYPWPTLLVCIALAAAATFLTVTRLEFQTDRSDLVDPDLTWNRRYADYKDRFERWDDVIIVLEGDPEDEGIDTLARRIADQIVSSERVLAADAGFDVAETGPRLFAIAPEPVFEYVLGELQQARRLSAADNANEALAFTMGALQRSEDQSPPSAYIHAPEPLEQLEQMLQPYLAALAGEQPDFSFIQPRQPRWLPLVSESGSGRMRFIQVQFAEIGKGVAQIAEHVQWLRDEIDEIVAESGVSGIEWGVTGIPAIEADETAQSIRDSTIATLVALVLITVLMLAVFRGVLVPLLAAASLVIGMAWSFGWLILTVGHLQLLSVVFTVILLGLGIDFAVHLVARLELIQGEHEDLTAAAERAFRGVGPGMVTGAVTTAAAFGATALTQFTGMKEMGIIAGGGILLCLVAVLSCFPAALAATGRWKSIIRHRPGGESKRFARGRFDVIDFHPKAALIAACVVTVALAVPALRTRYDPNVLNLHPPGIESVEWERRIVEDDMRTVWAALIRTTEQEAPALVDRLRSLPQVSDVGAMGILFSRDREERAAQVAEIATSSAPDLQVPPDARALRGQLETLRQGLLQRARTAEAAEAEAERLRHLAGQIRDALQAAATVDSQTLSGRVSALHEAFAEPAAALRAWVESALAHVPPGPEDLPDVLRKRWLDEEQWLLHVYPVADPGGRSILDPDRLEDFVNALIGVDPTVTGPPVQIYESSELFKREYVKAACYAVAAILILLLLDFRSLADALCSFVPVAIGFIGVFGLMGLFGLPLNFANIIVMPLIFGIGVDAGVHVVHRWRAEPYGRPAGLNGGTGRGITLTMMTTMIGFGSMLIAQHRGIRSLGFVMVAGLGVTLLACYVVLPAILRLRTSPWRERPEQTREISGKR